MTNQDVINFLNHVRKILLDDKSWLESTIQPINEAFDKAISALQAQDVPDTNVGDMISRQAAIDIERNATVDTNPSHFEAHQKFTQFMDDAEISSFGRWQWSNGFNTALTAVGIDLKKLPSVQPEPDIIACGDCKHWICHDRRCGYWNHGVKPLDWCCHGERRTDE